MLLNLSLSSIALVFMLIWLRQGLGLHTSAGTLGTAVGQAAVGWPPLPRPVGGIRDSNAQTTRSRSFLFLLLYLSRLTVTSVGRPTLAPALSTFPAVGV
jgi:hypothetical protein